ncbi:hypothetical protein [Pajaroellobacter abortibovis]|uniref:hypothetical protein n=1 Tax=Pajaroellobacter abortibovis TaxID=1882918 RepID=UPI0012EC334A|nr:hypothetical protein [Pajaroellobacter abortibovis]
MAFQLDFGNGQKCAYKPFTTQMRTRYRNEVAAYRLARALGLLNVPSASTVCFDKGKLRAIINFGREARRKRFDQEVRSETKGKTWGALMRWISPYQTFSLKEAQWKPWLKKGGEVPSSSRSLAVQLSTLLVFDVLIGNWDRWSGNNLGLYPPTQMLLYIDHDGAFFYPEPPLLQKTRKKFQDVDRFSRGLIEAIRVLLDQDNQEKLISVIGEEQTGVPLLSSGAMQGIRERGIWILEQIEKKKAILGDSEVLYFE